VATVTTTLALACGMNDTDVKVTATSGCAAGQYLYVENEVMLQRAAATGLWLPVRRGQEGSAQVAHAAGATVTTQTALDVTTAPDLTTEPTGYQATVTLTDAQIKALPTTPVIVVPAPGENRVIVTGVILGDPAGDSTLTLSAAANYTNITSSPVPMLRFRLGSGAYANYYNIQEAFTYAVQWGEVVWPMGYNDFASGGQNYDDLPTQSNQPVKISIVNGALGNWTGGHASNQLIVTVAYRVYDLTTDQYV